MAPAFTLGHVVFSLWIKADGRSWVMPRQRPLGECHRCEAGATGAFWQRRTWMAVSRLGLGCWG